MLLVLHAPRAIFSNTEGREVNSWNKYSCFTQKQYENVKNQLINFDLLFDLLEKIGIQI